MRTELKRDERLVLEVTQHGWVIAGPIFLFALVLLGTISVPADTGSLKTLLAGATVVLAINLLVRILVWKAYVWLVTSLRVIAEHGVLSRHADECRLDKINNVTYHQSLFGRIFGYGDVMIQTAAEMGATRNRFVRSPKLLKDTITRCQEEYRVRQIKEQAESLAEAMKGRPAQPAPRPLSEGDTKECPFCAETIKAKATICRFCGKQLAT